ncbi:MAG: TlpA family protein disulfide reductase [Oscillospiraceae bacterium]|nr:TlpA family protein disulfide reductase [Oscillospiraceae bacterium]
MKQILCLFLALLLTGCGAPVAPREERSVTLRSIHGGPLPGIEVTVWQGQSPLDRQITDETGTVRFGLLPGDYHLTLDRLPLGYTAPAELPLTDTVTLTTAPIPPEQGSPTSLGLGDLMYDFTLTTPTGKIFNLSQTLQEKELVLLEFWYTGCRPCATSFTALEVVYSQLKDRIAVIGADPLEDAATVSGYKKHSFPLAPCPSSWTDIFGITMYPTTVLIDRWGVIRYIHRGAISDPNELRQLLTPYLPS